MSNAQNTIEAYQEPLKGIWLVLGAGSGLGQFYCGAGYNNCECIHLSHRGRIGRIFPRRNLCDYLLCRSRGYYGSFNWLVVSRFGSVKVFSISMVLFGFSR